MSIAPAFYWRAASDGSAGSLVQVVCRSNHRTSGAGRFFLGVGEGGGGRSARLAFDPALAEYARLLANTDPHPLPRFRLNGTLSNMAAFAKAFSCKPGEPMVRPDAER